MANAISPVATVFLFLLFHKNSLCARRLNSIAGPFRILLREASQCPPGTIDPEKLLVNLTGTLHHERAYNGMAYDGLFIINKDVHQGDVGIKLNMAKWDSVSGWRENAYVMDGGEFCTVMTTIGKDFTSFISSQVPHFPTKCPIHSRTYKVQNFSTTIVKNFEHFPIFYYGRFRGDLMFYNLKSKVLVGCFRGVSDVVPKQTW